MTVRDGFFQLCLAGVAEAIPTEPEVVLSPFDQIDYVLFRALIHQSPALSRLRKIRKGSYSFSGGSGRIGQTGRKTQAKLTEALGRVLFMDEAYCFYDGGFGKEAINELVDSMTNPNFAGKIVVILAGYTNDMDNLLQMNPGLSSRFPEKVVFSNMALRKGLMLLEREIKNSGIDVVPTIKEVLFAQYRKIEDTSTELSKLPK
ncbi:MAG: hypothetical protein Q9181_006918 [Wetmoreana brouardii]